ncbi:MAG TPA: TetR/AcrR family transcriptional regulator [Metabacillus sp.]|nr:TetR/AcrR family transcriptional regulator [Metabacillus sp.]
MKKGDKKQRIIDASYKVFAKKGYTNASIKDIAREADVTPGLVHYYFESKLDLLLSVQRHVQDQYHQLYKNKDVKLLTPSETLQEIKSRAEKDPEWYRWRYEIYSLGLKNGEIQTEVAKILQDGRDSLSTPLKKLDLSHQDSEIMASILLACFDGLALQKIMDPTFELDKAYQLLEDLFEVYFKK